MRKMVGLGLLAISAYCVFGSSSVGTQSQSRNAAVLYEGARVIPGDGVTPLVKILRKLAEKGYEGPLSVELFLPKFQQGDPFEVAREIRQKSEAVMRQARVI